MSARPRLDFEAVGLAATVYGYGSPEHRCAWNLYKMSAIEHAAYALDRGVPHNIAIIAITDILNSRLFVDLDLL